jgi:hypothetical protein
MPLTVQEIKATDGTFTRASAAYLPNATARGSAYANHARRLPAVVMTNAARPEMHLDEIAAGNDFIPRCTNGTYMFGCGNSSGVWRTADLLTFTQLQRSAGEGGGNMPSLTGSERLWALKTGTIIRSRVNGTTLEVYRSIDHGDTWTHPFDYATANAITDQWSLAQAPHGTVIMSEYSGGGTVRKIYRSTDDGATWTNVYTEAGSLNHYHGCAYHAGTQQWFIGVGDGADSRILNSTNDGVTWQAFYSADAPDEQPTAFLDYGHPDRILFGSDRCMAVGTIGVRSTSAEYKQFRRTLTSWDPRATSGDGCKAVCFGLAVHRGVIYAASLDATLSTEGDAVARLKNIVLSVSSDGENWGHYARLPTNGTATYTAAAAYSFCGELNGRVHYSVAYQDESAANTAARHVSFMPAQVAVRQGLLIEPATENTQVAALVDGADATTGGTGINRRWGLSGGTAPAAAVAAGEGHDAGGSAVRFTSGANTLSFTIPCHDYANGAAAFKYVQNDIIQVRFFVKGKARYIKGKWYDNTGAAVGAMTSDLFEFYNNQTGGDGSWLECVSQPVTIAAVYSGEEPYRYILSVYPYDPSGTPTVNILIDSVQVQKIPATEWMPAATAKSAELLQISKRVDTEWSHIFKVFPRGSVADLTFLAGAQYIGCWKKSSTDFVLVWYDPADDKIKIQVTTGGAGGTTLLSAAQFWQRRAQLMLCLRKVAKRFYLTLANGLELEHLGPTDVDNTTVAGQILIQSGNSTGANVLPHVLSDSFLYPTRALSQSEVEGLMGLATISGDRDFLRQPVVL